MKRFSFFHIRQAIDAVERAKESGAAADILRAYEAVGRCAKEIGSEKLQERARLFECSAPPLGEQGVGSSLGVMVAIQGFSLLRDRFYEVLGEASLARIDERDVQFLGKWNLFGDKVAEAFPSASGDVEDAGNCLAFDLPTACVMHLMRVLQIGLEALAKDLGVGIKNPNMQNIINDIQSFVGEEGKKGTHNAAFTSGRTLQFYQEAAVGFLAFKDAWRNLAVHGRSFKRDKALSILEHVKAFMQHLAENEVKQ